MRKRIMFVGVLFAPVLVACTTSQAPEILDAVKVGVVASALIPPKRVTVDAGPDQIVIEGDTVTLTGRANVTNSEDTFIYKWNQTGGPVVPIDSSDKATAYFVAPEATRELILTFGLVAGVSERSMREDSVTIIVTPMSISD